MVRDVRPRPWVTPKNTTSCRSAIRASSFTVRPAVEPFNLSQGWAPFGFVADVYGKPACGVSTTPRCRRSRSYRGGRLLFLGVGTGAGSAMIVDGVVQAMELAHLPFKNGQDPYEDYAGKRGPANAWATRSGARTSSRSWRVCATRSRPVTSVIGGGNAVCIFGALPAGVRLGNNANAFVGGARLWELRAAQVKTSWPCRPRRAQRRVKRGGATRASRSSSTRLQLMSPP